MNSAILIVDDDPNILASYRRSLGRRYDLTVAEGGAAALELLDAGTVFAVIISDQSMPGMDGVQFLAEAGRRNRETIHMMLTGNVDQRTAADAINHCRVFRFLNKPCEPETLDQAIVAALRQYDLITAERVLLRKTVTGSVRLLTDLLSQFEPRLFAKAGRVRETAKALAQKLVLAQGWRFELGGMLCPLGMLTVPRDVIEKHEKGLPLSTDEEAVLAGHPQLTARLLRHIPRLDAVADLIAPTPVDPASAPCSDSGASPSIEEQVLPLALELDRRVMGGEPFADAVRSLGTRPHAFDPILLEALADLKLSAYTPKDRSDLVTIDVGKLKGGMVLQCDLKSIDGRLLVATGCELSPSLLERLMVFRRLGKIEGTVVVTLGRSEASEGAQPTNQAA